MNAVCYKCGEAKDSALVVCPACQQQPEEPQDQIVSVVLSTRCVHRTKLVGASEFVKRKKRLPKISDKLIRKAMAVLEAEQDGSSSSVEYPSSFFDFRESSQEDEHSITVHVIGRPNISKIKSPTGPPKKTYHTEEWVLGSDVSREDADRDRDDETGCLYAWYRLIGGRWTWKLVSRQEFEELKSVEEEAS